MLRSCSKCGRVLSINEHCFCQHTEYLYINTSPDNSWIVLQKLDKIIDLLERLPEKEEDMLLGILAKSGLFEQIKNEKRLSDDSNDWIKELANI